MKIQVIALGVMCAGALSMAAVQAEEAAVGKEEAKGEKGKSRFVVADTDANGAVSLEEFKVMFAKRPPRPQTKDGTPAPTAEAVFNKLDTDKSGSLSSEEMIASRKSRGKRQEGKLAPKAIEEQPAAQ